VVIGDLVSAQETKAQLADGIASVTYLAERLDGLVGLLTTKLPEDCSQLSVSRSM
jgi:hypothetical protein